MNQSGRGTEYELEVCVFDDASTDSTSEEVLRWKYIFDPEIQLVLVQSEFNKPMGVGFGRNESIKHSSGSYLCFQDVDDIMHPNRISKQLKLCKKYGNETVSFIINQQLLTF